MKIKIFFVLILSGLTYGQSDYVKKLPLVSFKLRCLTETRANLEGVAAEAHDDAIGIKEEFRRGESLSDKVGKCLFEFHALAGVSVYTKKEGYYPSIAPASDELPIDERFRFDPFIYRDDIPRSAQQNPPMKKKVKLEASIIMREIKNPIPLYGKRIRMDIPARDVWLGYDFEVGDWVKPYGKGIRSDMRMRSKPKRFDPKSEYGLGFLPGIASLEIDFGDGGGLVRVTKDNGWLSVSEMKMPHLAPATGYEHLATLKMEQTTHNDPSEMGKAKGYFFRTRVQRDGDKIISANYGKFWGGIKYIPAQRDGAWLGDDKKNLPAFGSVEFIYYFNPTANDRNLEFDLEQNLFKRLDPGEWVRQP